MQFKLYGGPTADEIGLDIYYVDTVNLSGPNAEPQSVTLTIIHRSFNHWSFLKQKIYGRVTDLL